MIAGLQSRLIVLIAVGVLFSSTSFGRLRFTRGARPQKFTATAYSVQGTTANGDSTRRGMAAADPAVIPLGSKIRIRGAGKYSGVYTVGDTGPKVKGRTVDIYVPNDAAAKDFGKKDVTVQILRRGNDNK